MLLRKCISAVLTAMIVTVSCFAAPFMNVSCVHEADAGLISKCVLQCSYNSKEPGTIRITVKTQALAVMDTIGVTGLVVNRFNENTGRYELYKRLGLFEENSVRYALIDNMKVDAPAGDYHITCIHFASGKTKTLEESEQIVRNETYVRVEEDAPAPVPPVTTVTTTKNPVVTTTTARRSTGSTTTATRNNILTNGVSTAAGKIGSTASVTTASPDSTSNGASAGGAFNGAANSSSAQSNNNSNTQAAAGQTTASQADTKPADSPRTGAAKTVPAGVLAALAALALATGKRRRS